MKLDIDDKQANWILNGLKSLLINSMTELTFSEVVDISEFGSSIEQHLNLAVKGNPVGKAPEPLKDRFVLGQGNTGYDRTEKFSNGIKIKATDTDERGTEAQ